MGVSQVCEVAGCHDEPVVLAKSKKDRISEVFKYCEDCWPEKQEEYPDLTKVRDI